MSFKEGSPNLDPAMERLAQHIQEGGGADDIPAQTEAIARVLMTGLIGAENLPFALAYAEVEPQLGSSVSGSEEDTLEMSAITDVPGEGYGWTPEEQPRPIGHWDL